jgi:RecB family endonuclease NucS
MYQINKQNNSILQINSTSFSSLKYRERENLQEWIASTPEIFWEDLLIIQKEFDGFNDTRERLDLLALDKQGNLVIIENKLDDTGRDVVWQSLKYASYCSTLKKWDIINIFQSYLDKYTQGKTAQSELEFFYEWR